MDLILLKRYAYMVPCCGRRVEINLVGCPILYPMCPMRTHPGVSASIWWSV